ncbi:MAG: DMT family transporter [Bryobacteraceae bacterium]
MPKGNPSPLKLYSLIGAMTTLWSINYVIAKFALREFPALLLTSLRMVIAGLIMIAIYLWSTRRGTERRFERSDIPLLITLGLLGVGLNQTLFVLGISRTSVAHASIMIALTPVIVLVLAALAGQEKLRPVKLFGMAIAMCGVGLLQFTSSSDRTASVTGDFLIFLCSVTFAIFAVRGKGQAGRVSGILINTFAYGGTGLVLLPVALYLSRDFPYAHVSAIAWTSLLYMVVFPSIVCYLIYYYALRYLPASRITAFSYLQPLIATLTAIPFLSEQPGKSLLFGGALVLTGVFIAERV